MMTIYVSGCKTFDCWRGWNSLMKILLLGFVSLLFIHHPVVLPRFSFQVKLNFFVEYKKNIILMRIRRQEGETKKNRIYIN